MGLLGSSGPNIDENDLKSIKGDLNELARRIGQTEWYSEDRKRIHNKVGTLLYHIKQITDGVELPWVPVEDNATADEIASFVREAGAVLEIANIDPQAEKNDLTDIRNAINQIHEAVDDATEFPYAYTELDISEEMGKPLQSIGIPQEVDPAEVPPTEDPEEVYAGPYARKAIEAVPRKDPGADLYVGIGTRAGNDVGIDKGDLFTHRAVFGLTGTGKSTKLTNEFKQLMETDAGGCFIDPKGDDAQRLIRILPEDRLDDVIWIEPSGTSDYQSGFNFISLSIDEDDPHYDLACANLVDDLVKLLGAGNYWGERMDRVGRNLITAMNRLNKMTPDDELDLTFVDLYHVLRSEASRKEFAALADKAGMPFVSDYTQEVAEMDDDMLEPLLGRFQQWIQNDMARRMIGFREAAVNISEAVEDNKIIIVRMGMENDDLKQMLGMAIIRRIWTAIRSRASMDEYERDPYYLFADEFDNLVMRDTEIIQKMVSKGRAYKLSMTMAMQYPNQVPEDVMEAITTNCKSIESFNPGNAKQARAYNTQLALDSETLTSEADFHFWMRLDKGGGMERSEAFRVYSYPPYPPKRTIDERDTFIEQALRRFGREKPSTDAERKRLLYHEGQGRWETGIGKEIAHARDEEVVLAYEQKLQKQAPTPEDVPLRSAAGGELEVNLEALEAKHRDDDEDEQDETEQFVSRHGQALLESIYAAAIKKEQTETAPVRIDRVEAELEQRIGDTGYKSRMADAAESLPQYIELTTIRDDEALALTPDGVAEVFGSTGEDPTGGGTGHRRLARAAYRILTYVNYDCHLPTQDGTEQADGFANSPLKPADIETRNKTAKEIRQRIDERVDRLKEEYPEVAELSGGRDIHFEIETNTRFKPVQLIKNLQKAINNGNKTLFIVEGTYFRDNADGRAPPEDLDDPTIWSGIQIDRLLYDREWDPETERNQPLYGDTNVILAKRREDGGRIFYNRRSDYRVDGYTALRPATDGRVDVTWRETADGEIIATDNEHGELARFSDVESVVDGDTSAVPAYYKYDQQDREYVVYAGNSKFTYGSEEEFEEEWEPFKAPLIPDADLETWPDADDFAVLIIPGPDNPDHDQPILYEHGMATPLYDALGIDRPETRFIPSNNSDITDDVSSAGDDVDGADQDDHDGAEADEEEDALEGDESTADDSAATEQPTAGTDPGAESESDSETAPETQPDAEATATGQPDADSTDAGAATGDESPGTDDRTPADGHADVGAQAGADGADPDGQDAEADATGAGVTTDTAATDDARTNGAHALGDEANDGADTGTATTTDTAEPDYAFPEVASLAELPDTCPECSGGRLILVDTSDHTGPATELDNFPAVAGEISTASHLDLDATPPTITEPIETTHIRCGIGCGFTGHIYDPTGPVLAHVSREAPDAASSQGQDTPTSAPDQSTDGVSAPATAASTQQSDGATAGPSKNRDSPTTTRANPTDNTDAEPPSASPTRDPHPEPPSYTASNGQGTAQDDDQQSEDSSEVSEEILEVEPSDGAEFDEFLDEQLGDDN